MAVLPAIMIAATVASTAVGVAGQISAAHAASQNAAAQQVIYNYNASMAQRNSQIAAQNAQVTQAQYNQEIMQKRMNEAAVMGTQRAQFAGSGVELDGSPLDVLAQTSTLGQLDVLTSQYNNMIAQNQAKIQEQNFGSEAGLDKYKAGLAAYQGAQQARNSYLGAAGTLLTGVSRVGQIGYSTGMFQGPSMFASDSSSLTSVSNNGTLMQGWSDLQGLA